MRTRLPIWIALVVLIATDVAATSASARPSKSHRSRKKKPAPPPAPTPPATEPMPEPVPAAAPEPPAALDPVAPEPAAEAKTRPLPPPAPRLTMRTPAKAHGGFVDSMDCSACHTADGWKLSQAASSSGFDHDRTGFPLRGAHVQNQCSSCHTGKAPPPTSCEGCHRDPHQGRNDGACAECHTATAWSDTTTLEQHRRTRMPLTGRHATVDCTACHKQQNERRFSDTPTDCYACHQAEYHATTTHPLHNGLQGGALFPRDCGRCHQTTSWQPAFADPSMLPRLGASTRAIDHDAWFTLSTGSHRNAECSSCHADSRRTRIVRCDGCHLDSTLRAQHGAPVASRDRLSALSSARSRTMRRLVAIAIVCAATPAAADSIAVKVTEVAGGVAYLSPGRAAGIIPGTKVRFRGRTLSVFEVTEKSCAVRADRLSAGDAGTADVDRSGTTRVEQLAKPRSPQMFDGQWPDPVMPALVQAPATVSLGSGKPPGRAHITVLAYGFGGASKAHVDAEAEARVIASYDLWEERPLAVDLDFAGRVSTAGFDRASRTPVFVRAAQLRYGDARDPRLAIGRLRYAATSVGMLDGVRASTRVGSVEASAFGGLVPDPLNGRPDTAASRFGGELAYDDVTARWQPRIALAGYGSTWEGSLDERRLAFDASAGRDAIRLNTWAEAQQFPTGNPWGARSIELTGAGASAQLRKHGRYVGMDLTFLRPERSLRLAAALPPDWLCTRVPQPGTVDEACATGDYWTSATGSTGMRTGRWAVDAIGSVGRSHGVYRGTDTSGYLRGELALATVRLLGGAAGGHASFGSWVAAEGGIAFVPSRGFDVAWRYRPQLFDYVASTGPVLLHSIAADGRVAVSPELDAGVSALATVGENQKSIALLGTIAWRPLP